MFSKEMCLRYMVETSWKHGVDAPGSARSSFDDHGVIRKDEAEIRQNRPESRRLPFHDGGLLGGQC